MTENTILKSVKFDRDELVGGGAINNKPPIPLLATEENLSRYMAIFPDYSIDKGNILRVHKRLKYDLKWKVGYP